MALADFGPTPRTAAAPKTAEQKAAAAAKRSATRTARGTKGPKARKAVHSEGAAPRVRMWSPAGPAALAPLRAPRSAEGGRWTFRARHSSAPTAKLHHLSLLLLIHRNLPPIPLDAPSHHGVRGAQLIRGHWGGSSSEMKAVTRCAVGNQGHLVSLWPSIAPSTGLRRGRTAACAHERSRVAGPASCDRIPSVRRLQSRAPFLEEGRFRVTRS
jgi:hypothetical protein